MITDKGKNILGKYLIGTAPAYASYIAVGCGATPLLPGHSYTEPELLAQSQATSLEFEMFRIPITSRGFIEENGETQLVFSGEIPTTERYEITEVGIFSASSNPSATGYDSRTLYAFTREEPWKFNEQLLTTIDSPLDDGDTSNNISDLKRAVPVIQTNATNRLFANLGRQERFEQSRYLNNMIMVSSNFSDLSGTTVADAVITGENRISLPTGLDLSQNSPSDTVKLALSVVDVDSDAGVAPNRVRVVVEFTTIDNSGALRLNFESTTGDLADSRYQILTATLGSGILSGSFLWSKVNNVNIYGAAVDASGDVIVGGDSLPTYYVALDAIRLENISSLNPLYGLTGYSVIENEFNGSAKPIVKLPNSSAMIEFRLGVGIYNG